MKIDGQVALVTGANRGVGKAFVEELARRGARKVYAGMRDPANAPHYDVDGVEIVPILLDITKPENVVEAALKARDVTLLVNNAGVNRVQRAINADDVGAARDEMEVNYFGTLTMARSFAPVIQANGGGAVVNMLSILAQVCLPTMASLSASKAAAYSATQGMRAELGPRGIEVLAVMPGAIDTDMMKDYDIDKMPAADVAREALDALERGEWEVYPGEMAKGLATGLKADPLAVQKDMAGSLKGAPQGSYVTLPSADGGEFRAYVAKPAKGSGPALILLQEIFGINGYMRSMADHFAEEGYVAIVPDLFWRLEPGVDLGYSEQDFAKAFDLYQRFDVDHAVADIQATINAAKEMPDVKGKVGAVGYCLGGLLAFLTAARTNVDVAVGYYAVGADAYLGEADNVDVPLVLHVAGADKFCPPEAQAKIKAAFEAKPNVQVYTYEGQDHAFATPGREHFDKPSTLMAYSRTLAALRGTLGPIYDLEHLWDMHCYHEFATRDVDATMATMVAEPYVNHIPTMTGGVGHDHLKRFYKYHFVDSNPEDTRLIPISRTIGADRLVDEMVFCFTHTREIDWMLPGIAPTGRYVEVPLVAIVNFRGDKLYHEHIYWDQASVLVQIGKLDPTGLPVAGGETAKKLIDETLPSNALMSAAWATSEGKPI